MVESRSITIGSAPGPAPSDQARRIVSAITLSSWRMCPNVKARKNVPSVEGAITRNGRTLCVAPARRRSTWSMWVAPTRIAATKVSTFRPGRAPPTRPPRRTIWFTSASRPRRTMSVAGTRSPASATSVGSSKVTATRSIMRDDEFTGSASSGWDYGGVENHHFPKQGGTFRGCAAFSSRVQSVDRGLERDRPDEPRSASRGRVDLE